MRKDIPMPMLVGMVAAALVLLALVYKARSVDLQAHNVVSDTLQKLERLDSELNGEVLRVKLALNEDYDALAKIFPRLEKLEASLSEGPFAVRGRTEPRVDQALDSYIDLMDDKEKLTERFKSHHSVLRNSSSFVPISGGRLVEQLARAGESDVVAEVKALVKDTLEYSLLGNARARSSVGARIDDLAKGSQRVDAVLQTPLRDLIAHAQTILKEKPITDGLLRDIIEMPSAQYRNDLSAAYENFYNAAQGESDIYRMVLAVCTLLLLAALGYVGYRLQKSYFKLNEANMAYIKANKDLTLRTNQLRKALTTIKESQSQLIQSEKMSSLGQMVAGISHEINTPLGYVTSNVSIVKSHLERIASLLGKYKNLFSLLEAPESDANEIAEQLDDVAKVSENLDAEDLCNETTQLLDNSQYGMLQISKIISNLRDFSRVDRVAVEDYNVNEGLESTLLIAHNLVKNKVEVSKSYNDVPTIRCAPSQINQVFLNLITNAVQSIDGRGQLYLATRANEGFVEVIVRDSGKGIPKDVVKNIFDPFFTTKKVGEGTGLGLSIAYRIVKQHGGKISVSSVPGKGARFTVSLPIGKPASQEEDIALDTELSSPRAAGPSARGGLRSVS
ncbi:MAG: DAHL domain-containing protein [Gammaproteobacteria bacterium]